MKVVIIEDELAASENLIYLLKSIDPGIEVLKVMDSVKTAVSFFSSPNTAELAFMDIHLADGLSFEIFDQVRIKVPVVFTTAYDQYTLKAFKVNSIDYLLKPIDQEELSEALDQFIIQTEDKGVSEQQVKGLLSLINTSPKAFKTTFLVNQRDQMIPLKTDNIAYFYIDQGIVKGQNKDNISYIIDSKLEDIESELNPAEFYRVNRQFIVNRNAIENIKHYFNGKLIVTVKPVSEERIVVSKAKATSFKNWMSS